jgi:5S rRNA maturation endonuclease (ribonuclease M5)
MYNREFITEFYEKHLDMSKATKGNGDGELRALCPAHKDRNPSFSVNLDTGLYNCFSPSCPLHGGGNIHKFKAVVDQVPYTEAVRTLDKAFDEAFPDHKKKSNRGRTVKDFPYKQEALDAWEYELIRNPERLGFLKKKCLWTEETIKRFNIGWDGARYTIPIKEAGKLVNIRFYSPHVGAKWTQVAGFSEPRLFPFDNTEAEEIVLVEGEKDCVLANQIGLHALTVTGGAGTWKTYWKQYFKGKNVVIIYDIDSSGREGAEKIVSNLSGITKSIKNVELPINEPENADLTDYFLTGKTPQDLQALIDSTQVLEKRTHSVINIPNKVYTASLSEVNEQSLFYKRCRTKVRTVGKDSAPFITAKKICVTCNKDNGKSCFNCGVNDLDGKAEVELNETTPHILELIECSASDKKRIIRELLNIPTCRKFEHTEEGHQPVIRVSVIPAIDEMNYEENASLDAKYVEREMYFIGKDLDNNVDYEIEAIAVPSAKDQTLVHLGYKVNHADSSVENFKMTPEVKQRLSVFQCKTSESKLTESTPT